MRLVVALVVWWTWGCGDDDAMPTVDAGGAADGGTSDEWSVAAPNLLPCPTGWREVAGDPTVCDPWPEAGPEVCGDYEHHLPGEPSCTTVGTGCVAGDEFASGLPSDRLVVYALAGAAAGGDGTLAAPHLRIRDAIRSAGADGVVAVGRGRYDEIVDAPSPGVTVWGACTAETFVSSTVAGVTEGVVRARGPAGTVRNLSLGDSERMGVSVVGADATITVVDVVVASAVLTGLSARNGGQLDAEGVLVRDTVERAAGDGGRAVEASEGSTVTVSRSALRSNREGAVVAFETGTSIAVEDSAIRETSARATDFLGGNGINGSFGATVSAVRSVFHEQQDVGVSAGDPDTTISLEDVVIRDTRPSPFMEGGQGIGLVLGATATVRRTLFERNQDVSVFADGETVGPSVAELSDVVVRDTATELASGLGGRALNLQNDGTANVERVVFERSRGIAVFVGNASSSTITDAVIRDTGPRGDGFGGRALVSQNGGTVIGTRIHMLRTREVAAVALRGNATLRLDQVAIRDVATPECVTTGDCPRTDIAQGLVGGGEAVVEATRFVIEAAAVCGVQVAAGGTVTLADGEIAESAIGACVQDDAYDISTLMNDVAYRDNGVNLQTTTLPVPEPYDRL